MREKKVCQVGTLKRDGQSGLGPRSADLQRAAGADHQPLGW